MTLFKLLALALVIMLGYVAYRSLPDIQRYLKMRSM